MENEQFQTVEDLLQSDTFLEWHYEQKHLDFWKSWLANRPDRLALVESAQSFLKKMTWDKVQVSEAEVTAELRKVWRQIEQKESAKKSVFSNRRTLLKIAATFLLLVVGSRVVQQFFGSDSVVYTTSFGETQTITLPDQSTVMLQANSILTVPKNWSDHPIRQVTLEGQAYFEVTKTVDTKFEVSTPDFTVEVLGTTFDVVHRPNQRRIVLQEGKVRLNCPNQPSMDLVPNEMINYSAKDQQYQKTVVNARAITAWTQQQLVLDNTPLSALLQMLTDHYGLEVTVNSKVNQSVQRTSVGAIRITTPEELIGVLEASYEVKVEWSGMTVFVRG
ncbi:MAG: FecR domain-containing protein [Bacteroidota bacterium]